MDIDAIRQEVASGRRFLRIATHAQTEAFNDGLTLEDVRATLNDGTVLEDYPEQMRALIRSERTGLPVHVVIEDADDEVVIVTAYIPDSRLWTGEGRRRRRRRT